MQIYQKNKENRSIADIPRVQIQGVYWSILTELKKKEKKKRPEAKGWDLDSAPGQSPRTRQGQIFLW